ncbi:MAG TPA: lyase family protein [Acetobacteraceae bacterium]
MSDNHRLEHDSLGERMVPNDRLYGVQTLRAAENFPLSGVTLAAFPALLRALAMVKKAAAIANHGQGLLPEPKSRAIIAACDQVIAGQVGPEYFPVDAFQGGAGTSTNMNMNEVLANLALEHLGRPRGDYAALHPNDDVNLSQSTNDVYPTAVRLALVLRTEETSAAVGRLAAAFEAKAAAFADVVKLGRTELQDAVPITLGQEFGAYAATLHEDRARLREATGLLREVNLGGTAVGTRIICGRPRLGKGKRWDGRGAWSDAAICPAFGSTASCRGPVWEFADRVHINAACSRHVGAAWLSRSRLADRCAIPSFRSPLRPRGRDQLMLPRPEPYKPHP